MKKEEESGGRVRRPGKILKDYWHTAGMGHLQSAGGWRG